jgi:collagenase-like PrtC family protease
LPLKNIKDISKLVVKKTKKTQSATFSIGTNFDKDLVPQLINKNAYEIYGKLSEDILGGGRSSYLLPTVTHQQLRANVLQAHLHGLQFNYLLNSSCLDNREYSKKGFKELIALFDFLAELHVDTITVAVPYLVLFIKKNYPQFKIDVSTIAGVTNVKQFEYWQDLGVNVITLDTSANRDFAFLKYIAKHKTCGVKLIVNQGCDLHCIYRNYHYNVMAHTSQTGARPIPLSICSYNCTYHRVKNPVRMIQAPWIRPEDLRIYLNLGFSKFKIIQRHDPTSKILRTLNAYAQENYPGNLLDIVNFCFIEKQQLALGKAVKYLLKPHLINILKVYKLAKLLTPSSGITIENQKLSGLLKKITQTNCQYTFCKKCTVCDDYAAKSVHINKPLTHTYLQNYTEINRLFIDKKTGLFA